MTVAGQSSDPSVHASSYVYNDLVKPPVIAAVSPVTGPVSGGTVVELVGSGFAGSAVIELAALDGALALTGVRSTCEWRGVPGMSCNDTVVRCVRHL